MAPDRAIWSCLLWSVRSAKWQLLAINFLLVSVSAFVLETNVSEMSGKYMFLSTVCVVSNVVFVFAVPLIRNCKYLVLSVLLIIFVVVSISDLLFNGSAVFLPINVSVSVGRVNVPVLMIVEIVGDVNVLLDSVCVVVVPTKVVVASGNVTTILLDCTPSNVKVVPVVADDVVKLILLVGSTGSMKAHDVLLNDLFDNVSVVALPINVSVFVGKVNVPVLTIVDIMGAVNVLLVRVCVVSVPTRVVVASGKLYDRVVDGDMLVSENVALFVVSMVSLKVTLSK